METNELLLQLTKKLENKELYLAEDKEYFYLGNDKGEDIILGKKDKTGYIEGCPGYEKVKWDDYNPDWNNTFKEKFYQDKGINCFASKCPNKVCVKEGDHKKVKIFCGEKHTRILCIEHSKKYE